MHVDRPRSEYWSIQRGLLLLRLRGFLLLCALVFAFFGLVMLVAVLNNAWDIFRDHVPFDRQAQEITRTWKLAITGIVSAVVAMSCFALRRWIAQTRRVPLRAQEVAAVQNWVHRAIYAWIVRVSWSLLLVCSVGLARSNPREAQIPAIIGAVMFVVWLFVVRTFGPWTLNRNGRLERR